MRPRAVRKRYPLASAPIRGAFDIGLKVFLKVVVTGHLVALAAFFVKAHPGAAALHINIFDPHLDDGPDAREGIDHKPDQGAIPQAHR